MILNILQCSMDIKSLWEKIDDGCVQVMKRSILFLFGWICFKVLILINLLHFERILISFFIFLIYLRDKKILYGFALFNYVLNIHIFIIYVSEQV